MKKFVRLIAFVVLTTVHLMLFAISVNAREIRVNENQSGHFERYHASKHTYSFNVSSAGKIDIEAFITYDNGCWFTSITLSDSQGNIFYSFDLDTGDIHTGAIRVPAGSYTLDFNSGGEITNEWWGDFQFIINFMPESASEFEQEPNDTADTANVIQLNSTVRGNLSDIGTLRFNRDDIDWFKFTLNNSGRVDINFKHATADFGMWNVELFDDFMILQTSKRVFFNETDVNLDTQRLEKGDYYIKISGGGEHEDSSNVDYIITVNYVEELTQSQPTTPQTPQQAIIKFQINNTTYTINGNSRQSEAAPFIANGRTMVPLRIIAEAFGVEVDWIAQTRTATVSGNGANISLPLDVPLPNNMGTPVSVGGRTFVPLAHVAEVLGATTRWDGEEQTVYIYQ